MEVDVLTREGELAPIALDSVRLSIVAALAVVGVTAITCKLDLHLRNPTSYALTPSNLEQVKRATKPADNDVSRTGVTSRWADAHV